jgi:hypothetical protein
MKKEEYNSTEEFKVSRKKEKKLLVLFFSSGWDEIYYLNSFLIIVG